MSRQFVDGELKLYLLTGIEDSESRNRSKENQKRYRERVKAKKEGLEDQIAVLSRRVAELEATQSSLEDRNKYLERFQELATEKACRPASEAADVRVLFSKHFSQT